MSVQSTPNSVQFGASAVPYKGVVKVLEGLGYKFARQKGSSHQVWKHAKTNASVVVPKHGNEVSAGVVRDIAKLVGVSTRDLERLASNPKAIKKALKNGGVLA